ncbi:MAG TPA: outer membrane beta-barrel protein [Caulobacteraceae bacterium]|nr:outer membrane beta-barrel protein [Caulobacteraceae bacterium]
MTLAARRPDPGLKHGAGPLAVALAVAALTAAAPAWAQQATPFSSSVGGPVPGGAETVFDVATSLEYSSNIAGSNAQLAAARGLKLADVIFTPAADFTIARQLGRPLVYVNGSASYAVYTINPVRDRPRFDVDGGATGRFGPCQETLTGGYAHSQTDIEELALKVVNNTAQTADVGLAAHCGRSTGLTPTFSVQQSWLSNSAAIERVIDNRTFTADVGVGYTRPSIGTLSLFGNYSDTTYPNRRFLIFTGGHPNVLVDDFVTYGGGVRFERPVGARISVTATLGYTSLKANLPGSASFNGLTYTADVNYAVSSRLSTHAQAVRSTTPSTRPGGNFTLKTIYEADVSYRLGSRYTVEISAQRDTEDFPGASVQTTFDLTHEVGYREMLIVNYKMSKRLQFSLAGGEVDRQANFPGLSYSATTVTLTAHAGF